MPNIIGRAPFRLLGSHGVTLETIETFESRFGRTIPASVRGPDDVGLWACTVLPWARLLQFVVPKVERMFVRAGVTGLREQRILREVAAGARVSDEDSAWVEGIASTLFRLRGLNQEMPFGEIARLGSDELRAWGALVCLVGGSRMRSAEEQATSVWAACHWVEPDLEERVTYDLFLREVMEALAAYIKSWTWKGGLA